MREEEEGVWGGGARGGRAEFTARTEVFAENKDEGNYHLWREVRILPGNFKLLLEDQQGSGIRNEKDDHVGR